MLPLALPLLLFALITWQVVADGPLVGVDERLSRALVAPDRASELLADLGNVEVAVPVLALALAGAAWSGPLVAAARRGGRCDGPGAGAGRPAEGVDRPPRHPGGAPGGRLLPVRAHRHRRRGVRGGGGAPPSAAAPGGRPARSGAAVRGPRAGRLLRAGAPGLPLAAGRGGVLVPGRGAAAGPVPAAQRK